MTKTSKKFKKIEGEGTLRHQVEYEEYIQWCATPELYREIKTEGELAKKFQVSQATLVDWKKRSDFRERMMAHIKNIFGATRTANIVAAIYKNGLGNSYQDRKLWLQVVEGWREETVQHTKPDQEPTAEEKKSWERIKQKHKKKKG